MVAMSQEPFTAGVPCDDNTHPCDRHGGGELDNYVILRVTTPETHAHAFLIDLGAIGKIPANISYCGLI